MSSLNARFARRITLLKSLLRNEFVCALIADHLHFSQTPNKFRSRKCTKKKEKEDLDREVKRHLAGCSREVFCMTPGATSTNAACSQRSYDGFQRFEAEVRKERRNGKDSQLRPTAEPRGGDGSDVA